MSTLLIKRAYRVLMLSMATMLIAGLLAPIVAVASTELVAGDTAVVNNPDGTGAYLRTDTTVLDDTTIAAELPQGSTVWVMEAPVYNDTGVWVYVAAEGFGPGWVSTSMLQKVTSETAPETDAAVEDAPESEAPVATLPWLEPVDSATVIDPNLALPVEGLAVLVSIDGPTLGHALVGSTLDVTGEREWVGEKNYVRVNFNGAGAYVDGAFIALESEAVVEEPAEEVIWVDEEAAPAEDVVTDPAPADVPAEEAPVTDAAPVEVPAEEVPVTEPAPADVPAEEAPVTDAAPVEVPAEEVPVTDPAPADVPAEEAPATHADPVEVPAEDEVVTDPAPADVPAEDETVSEPAPDAAPLDNESTVASPAVVEAPVNTAASPAVVEAPATAEVDTEADVATPAATEPAAPPTVQVPTATATAAAPKAAATTAPTVVATTAPVKATAVPTQVSTPAPIASTAKTFDAKAMIGSATVTGTTSGLLCRTQPNPSAPVLMTLAEGTKVLVSSEAVNGYLGIDCGGLQGFADVNYLWSGGAGDGEIRAARMNVVVTGTGNGLNCRTGAGLNYPVITTVFDGTSLVTRGAASNGWTPVTCAGKNGFVSTTWIEPVAGSTSGSSTVAKTSTGSARVTTGGDGLYCRSGAGTSYGVITVLSDGASVAVRGAAQGQWIPVTCGGKAGFAHSAYLNVTAGSGTTTAPKPSTGTGTATGSVTVANTGGQGLNCRSGAGTGYGIITTLSLGQTVKTRSGSVSGWTAVICGGTNGFVSSEFVTGGTASAPATPKPTAPAPSTGSGSVPAGTHLKTTDSVNLRYSASMSSSVSTVIPAGIVVKSTGAVSNSYYPVNYDGLTGYVHVNYLLKTSDALSKRGGSGTPVTNKPAPAPAPNPGSTTGSALVNYAMRYEGYPYVWATAGPASFDCSGFTYWVVKNVMGRDIGRGTWTQVSAGTPVGRNELRPGDLVFHQNTYTAGLSHVGLYIGNNQIINALNEDAGVVVTDISTDYWESRWYGAVRL